MKKTVLMLAMIASVFSGSTASAKVLLQFGGLTTGYLEGLGTIVLRTTPDGMIQVDHDPSVCHVSSQRDFADCVHVGVFSREEGFWIEEQSHTGVLLGGLENAKGRFKLRIVRRPLAPPLAQIIQDGHEYFLYPDVRF